MGELLTIGLATFGRRWQVFLAMTFVVVAPVIVLVDGVWGGVLAHGPRAHRPVGQEASAIALTGVVIPAVVTGLHCVVVAALSEGQTLGVAAAFRDVAPRLPRAFGAVLLYTIGVFVGIFALVIPGIVLAIRWYFTAQAAVLEGCSPRAATARSRDLVAGSWWRVAGLLTLIGIITGLIAGPARSLANTSSNGWIWVVCEVAGQTFVLSISAIFGTFLFFDLRARHDARPPEAHESWARRDVSQTEWLPPHPPHFRGG